jgi:peptidoglycan hydrolase-like protein with peptidoglycan-binding domain
MPAGRVKLQLVAFLILSGGVAVNIFLMQPAARERMARAVPPLSEARVAQAARVFTGDTGSIERSGTVNRSDLADIGTGAIAVIPKDQVELTRAVQRELQARGYETGAADGVAGQVTRAAIMGFEHDHGLPLTGAPSQQLLQQIVLGTQGARLGDARPSAPASVEAERIIQQVQRTLSRLGYKPGAVDGRLSPATARAIREFEVDQALPESGRISGPRVARLARLSGRGQIAAGI